MWWICIGKGRVAVIVAVIVIVVVIIVSVVVVVIVFVIIAQSWHNQRQKETNMDIATSGLNQTVLGERST